MKYYCLLFISFLAGMWQFKKFMPVDMDAEEPVMLAGGTPFYDVDRIAQVWGGGGIHGVLCVREGPFLPAAEATGWALFILLFSILVCYQPSDVHIGLESRPYDHITGGSHGFTYFQPPPPPSFHCSHSHLPSPPFAEGWNP